MTSLKYCIHACVSKWLSKTWNTLLSHFAFVYWTFISALYVCLLLLCLFIYLHFLWSFSLPRIGNTDVRPHLPLSEYMLKPAQSLIICLLILIQMQSRFSILIIDTDTTDDVSHKAWWNVMLSKDWQCYVCDFRKSAQSN